MIKTRSVSLSVEYRKTAYSTVVKANVEEAEGQGSSASSTSTSAAATTGSAGAAASSSGAAAGATVTLNATPIYVSSTATSKAGTKTGTYYPVRRRAHSGQIPDHKHPVHGWGKPPVARM